MTTGESFSDTVIEALSKDSEVLSAMEPPVWDAERKVLLVKITPNDQHNAKTVAEKAVELIRDIRGEKFRAEIQHLNVEGKMVYVFKLTLAKE